MAGSLEGKVALISGGARGMGAAETRLFVKEGAQVVVGDILDDEGKALVAGLDGAAFVHLDVSSEAEWAAAVKFTTERFGKLDILVNNAGIYASAPIEDTTPELYERVWRINQLGPFLGMRAVVPVMKAAGGGAIVNMSSVTGLMGYPNSMAYGATKWAVRGMSKMAVRNINPATSKPLNCDWAPARSLVADWLAPPATRKP